MTDEDPATATWVRDAADDGGMIFVAKPSLSNNYLKKAKIDALGKLGFGIDCHKTKFY